MPEMVMKSGQPGLSYAKQQRIYELIKLSKDRDSLKGKFMLTVQDKADAMTAKEKKLELEEIFAFKLMLANKLNHNIKQLSMIEAAIDDSKDSDETKKLERRKRTGEQLVSAQKTELSKLTSKRIAKQVNVSCSTVIYQYNQYTNKRL